MALSAGTRLGPYEILAPLGAGGMGEVYRARDTRLERSVAIKVLPFQLSGDAQRRARFEREAKTVSSLNHPHICALYDVGHEQGTDYLVMELVEGETLAERLKKGALPLGQTLRNAIEIADALDKAHRQGVIHRDLKPGNVMLTKAGSKLMDFGLAKHAFGEGSEGGESALPTDQAPLTGHGTLVGTLPYMAPEQLEGKEADARSDLWALGCVLYEMATGRRAFEGKSQASLISAIMAAEPPPIVQLQPLTPPSLERLVRVCLAKDPDHRLQTAHDVMQELTWIAESQSGSGAGAETAPGPRRGTRWRVWRLLPWAIAAAATLSAAAAWLGRPGKSTDAALPGRFSITLPPGDELADSSYQTLAVAPNGRDIVFAVDRVGARLLLRRTLDSLEARPVAGSEGGATMPFYSGDGSSIAFWLPGVGIAAAPTAGGAVRVVCESLRLGGGAWAPDGGIIVGGFRQGLSRCAPGSVKPEVLTSIAAGSDVLGHTEPRMLPDGRILFVIEHVSTIEEQRQIALLEPKTGAVRVLMRGATSPRFVPPRNLLFVRSTVLYSVTVDPSTLVPRGPERRLTSGVKSLTGDSWPYWHARYDVSARGPLVYEPDAGLAESELAWVDRAGALLPLPTRRQDYTSIALSPDGSRVAVGIRTGAGAEIWTLDRDRDVWARVSYGAGHRDPAWTRDGRRLLFASNRSGSWTVLAAAADGSGTPAPVGVPRNLHVTGTGSSYGTAGERELVFSGSPGGLFILRARESEAKGLTLPGRTEYSPAVSPDGRWLAHLARDTGGLQLYVRDLPELKTRSRVSTEGASESRWAADGRELYYRAGRRIMAVSISAGSNFAASRPRVVAEIPGLISFDVARDGRFLVVRRVSTPPPPQLVIVPDWRSLLAEAGAASAATSGAPPK